VVVLEFSKAYYCLWEKTTVIPVVVVVVAVAADVDDDVGATMMMVLYSLPHCCQGSFLTVT
jgi:hypothetical protein